MTFKEWYSEENVEKVRQWASSGLTRDDIAKNIGISTVSLWDWSRKSVNLLNALKSGQAIADEIVENALFKRANGYDVNEEQITYGTDENGKEIVLQKKTVKKHIPPDTTAQIFWLKNRKPDVWREKREVELSGEQINAIDRTLKVEFVDNGDNKS